MPFYGLFVPPKNGLPVGCSPGVSEAAASSSSSNSGPDSPYVFKNKSKALDVLKLHKDARMKEFNEEDEAVRYALNGEEPSQNSKYNDVKNSTAISDKPPFRAPSKQELIEFRKIIESGNYERVASMIWDNPRYLVSSGDTPTILKEGYRYNAMHVCAINQKPQIAKLILETVSDTKFVDLLLGKKNDEKTSKELCLNLLDFYLNIPEKGRSETPLHLASKIGCVEMVELLTAFPECKMTTNNEGLLPVQIICSRVPKQFDVIKKIESLLKERFYVPVLRSVDNAMPPQIGEPFSPNNPPDFNCDPFSPEMKIQALAGPMSKDEAKIFRRRWKTPPRMGSNSSLSPIINNPYISPSKSHVSREFLNASPTSSLNFKGRELFSANSPLSQSAADVNADEQNGNHSSDPPMNDNNQFIKEANNNRSTALCPNTPLIKLKREAFYTYREPAQPSPIVLDNHSFTIDEDNHVLDSPGFKERHIKNTDSEKGLELIGRELAKEHNVEWREYWDFLDCFVDITSAEGLLKLENYLAQRIRETELERKSAEAMVNSAMILDNVCNALEKLGLTKENSVENDPMELENGMLNKRSQIEKSNSSSSSSSSSTAVAIAGAMPQSTTPYTCVEKSLQVFAKRITKTIIHNIDNVVSINDTLLSELKRLKSLICSFKEDVRFTDVNFAKVHSRIGNLVSIYLKNSQEVTPAIKEMIISVIKKLLMINGERREHIDCVCEKICCMLKSIDEQIMPENLTNEDLCSQIWYNENTCACQWESNLSRKTSRRCRMEARYRQHQKFEEEKANTTYSPGASATEGKEELKTKTSDDADDNNDADDVFWSDFGSDTDEEEEVWFTPPESPTRTLLNGNASKDLYKNFVYGNEPTKRDLDVLNAIFHIDIDASKYPNITAWKSALLRYPNEDFDKFPSPAIIKTAQFLAKKKLLQTPIPLKQNSTTVTTPETSKASKNRFVQLPAAKKLFSSPSRQKPLIAPAHLQAATKTPTSLNKLRNFFRCDSNSSPAKPTSSILTESNDGSNNLSLFNISASE